MKNFLLLLLIGFGFGALAQPKVLLTPTGFAPEILAKPAKPMDKIFELSKNWGYTYNKNGHDFYEVTANSFKIDALKKGAFFLRNLGEEFPYAIKYTLEVSFSESTYQLKFIVKEIYQNDKRIETTIADYFTPDGNLKEDYQYVKPSLEKTANDILRSYAAYIAD